MAKISSALVSSFAALVCLAIIQASGGTSAQETEPKRSNKDNVLELRLASFEQIDGWEEFKIESNGKNVYLDQTVVVRDSDIQTVRPRKRRNTNSISIRLTTAGGKRLCKASGEHLGKPIAIFVNGKVLSAPVVNSKLNRDVEISGNFTQAEIDELVGQLSPRPRLSNYRKEDLDDLAQRLDRAHDREKFSGTVLIAVDGKIVFEKSVGFANIKDKTPFNQRSSFRLASVSKQFTAMGIMLLKEEGKLD